MKKIFLFLLLLLALFTAGTYMLIPSVISVSGAVVAKTTDIGTERILMNDSSWVHWWPAEKKGMQKADPKTGFQGGGYLFRETGKFYKSLSISIGNEEHTLPSKLLIVPLAVDSTGIEWKCELVTGNDPISRVRRYQEAKRIKSAIDEVLGSLRDFLSTPENVYGINIERNHLKDTLYVSSKTQLTVYPTQKDIYNLIGKINIYLAKHNSPATGSPIYNITQTDQNHFQLMAAVPTNRMLPETDGFAMKNMIKGSFIITEVSGGEKQVSTAWRNLKQFFQDYRKTSMAMNFTMLVTDRTLQPDSSKWVTKLYMPVY